MKVKKKSCLLFLGCLACGAVTLGGTLYAQANDVRMKAIEIKVDLNGYDLDEMPNALEGEYYPVFNYTAKDDLGNDIENRQALVYYDENKDTHKGNTADDVLVPIVDARFKTEKVGTYVIEYTASKEHVSAKERIYITALEANNYGESQYTVNAEIPSSVATGSFVYLLDGTIRSDSRFGRAELKTEIRYEGEYDCEEITVYGNENMTKYFVPTVAGEYSVVYTVTNILGENKKVEVVKTVSVTDSDVPVIKEVVFNQIIHKGEIVSLPKTEAVEYRNGKIYYVPVEVYFGENNITDTMTYAAETAGDFAVRYEATSLFDGSKKSVYSTPVTVLDTQEAKDKTVLEKHLYTNGLVSSFLQSTNATVADAVILTADGSQSKAFAQFKNPLAEKYLNLKVGVEVSKSNFERLFIRFTDSKEANQAVEVSFVERTEKNGTFVDVYLNGKLVNTLDNKVFSVTDAAAARSFFTVSYDAANKRLIGDEKKTLCNIYTYMSGEEFKGFSSQKAYVSFGMDGIEGESQLKLVELATQTITGSSVDDKKPFFVDEPFSGRVDYGSTVVIPKPNVFDVYDAQPVCTLKMTDSHGNVLCEKQLTDDYAFTVSAYGKINLVYTLWDESGNFFEKKKSIMVVDRVSPFVEAAEIDTEVSIGTTLQLPKATVTDNSGKACTLSIYVIEPDGFRRWVKWQEDGSYQYQFAEKGTYYVTYCAADEDGNITTLRYTVKSK